MNKATDKRVDLEMRTSIDRYLEHIKKYLKIRYIALGAGTIKQSMHFAKQSTSVNEAI